MVHIIMTSWHTVNKALQSKRPIVKPVEQPVVQMTASREQTFNRLSNRLFNRFDSRLNVCSHDAAGCSTAVVKPHKPFN